MWILFIILFLGLFFLIIILLKNHFKLKKVVYAFKNSNVIVFGAKGTGKDLLFQWIIRKRHEKYFSNIPYGYKYKHIDLKDVSVAPNTYETFINGDITKVKRDKNREGKDIYISDGGIYLPSQMDTKLYKSYPSFPIYYALSRHLYNSNIHVNTQNLTRVWKSLREQADYYILCVQTIKIGFILITRFISYDRYESAEKKLRPMTSRVLNKYSKAEYDVYTATNGDIHKAFIFQFSWNIKYDTRFFKKVIFNKKREKKCPSRC